MRVAVLGAGRVGGAIARDLSRDGEFAVRVADVHEGALESLASLPNMQVLQTDLSTEDGVRRAVEGADLVVGAVPGSMGYPTLQRVLEAGKNVVDISFFEEDPFGLDDLAKKKGLTALVDFGIAPGCSNLILGYLDSVLEEVANFECLVGGLPTVRTWPFEYKAPFSPSDVLEEYTRPARLVEHGEVVVRPALSEPELVDFPGVGTLEAFNTDGLRTLLKTVKAPVLKERTLRYPGHIEKMRMLREMGLFSKEPLRLKDGGEVVPLEVTSRLLFPLWQLGEGEEDLTVLRVTVEGRKAGARVRFDYELLDRYDAETGTLSMARTTGYTCTAGVRLLARGMYQEPGVSPPEYVGRKPGCYLFVMQELAKRGVVFRETVTG
jgi:lysine 6-dehydrogenase